MVQKKDKYGLYDPPAEKQAEVKYEMAKLPLQDYVATARRATCNLWTSAKREWGKVKDNVTGSVSKVRRKTQDQLRSIGLNNPALAMEVGAVGSAGLLGLLVARKRSLFYRLLYPTIAGGSVFTVIYFSHPDNRAVLQSSARKIRAGYQKNASQYTKDTGVVKEDQVKVTIKEDKSESKNTETGSKS